MRILIAEDDAVSRKLLEKNLEKFNHEVISAVDGTSAVEAYRQEPTIEMAILDWIMPGKSGLEVCRAIKDDEDNPITYVIMLTAKSSVENLAEALDNGADDFIAKPFDRVELKARINAGVRIIRLQEALMKNISELEEALAHVNQLQEILPICAWCKRIRDDSGYWNSVEEYMHDHSDVEFSHSICPECLAKKYPEEAAEMASESK